MMTDFEKEKTYFKAICSQRLAQYNLITLRNYGRHLNIPNPTCLKKSDLIKEILKVLCAEKTPTRNKRGAPSKHHSLQTNILFEIEELKSTLMTSNDTKLKKANRKDAAVRLKFLVDVDQLNERQKKLLNDFLNSL